MRRRMICVQRMSEEAEVKKFTTCESVKAHVTNLMCVNVAGDLEGCMVDLSNT